MSKFKTAVPHKKVGMEVEGAALAAATLPGTLVQITGKLGDYTATKNAVRGARCFVVYENEAFGKTVRDAIAAGEQAQCFQLEAGVKFTPIVKAGVAVAVGDLLIADVDGLVDKPAAAVAAVEDGTSGVTATWPVAAEEKTAAQLYRAEEACASNATGDNRRIVCRCL